MTAGSSECPWRLGGQVGCLHRLSSVPLAVMEGGLGLGSHQGMRLGLGRASVQSVALEQS